MSRNLRTADYPEEARRALGEAVAAARRAAGFKWRTDFSRAHPEVSVSSLKLTEQGKPLVGVTALQAIGAALGEHFPDAWTRDTPRSILNGQPAPDLGQASAGRSPAKPTPSTAIGSQDDAAFWLALWNLGDREMFETMWREYLTRDTSDTGRGHPQAPSPAETVKTPDDIT